MSYGNGIVRCGGGHTVFWMPVLGPDGQPYDKAKFPPVVVEGLRLRADVWNTQYLLREPGEHDQIFDEKKIREAMFRWADPRRTVMAYTGSEFDPDQLDEHGYTVMHEVKAKVALEHCSFYMHIDPTHRVRSRSRAGGRGQRPSNAAIVITAVAPDSHAFLVEFWTDDAALEGLVPKMLQLYRLWAPRKITWESIGAQDWLVEYVRKIEQFDPNYRTPRAATRYGLSGELPRMSSRMTEAAKTNESKEFVAQEVLSGWLNTGVLHLDAANYEVPLHQILSVLDEKEAIDIVDCLGQGPAVWQAPPNPSLMEDVLRRRNFVAAFSGQERTGFTRGGVVARPAGRPGRGGFRRPWD